MKTPKLLLCGEMTVFIITEHKGRKGNHGPGCLGTVSSSLPEIPASFLPLPWDPHAQKLGVHSAFSPKEPRTGGDYSRRPSPCQLAHKRNVVIYRCQLLITF